MKQYEVLFSAIPFPQAIEAETLIFNEETGQKLLYNNRISCDPGVLIAVVPADAFVYEVQSKSITSKCGHYVSATEGLDSDK